MEKFFLIWQGEESRALPAEFLLGLRDDNTSETLSHLHVKVGLRTQASPGAPSQPVLPVCLRSRPGPAVGAGSVRPWSAARHGLYTGPAAWCWTLPGTETSLKTQRSWYAS